MHRDDGPAVEWNDGSRLWFLGDKLHREDGAGDQAAKADIGRGTTTANSTGTTAPLSSVPMAQYSTFNGRRPVVLIAPGKPPHQEQPL